MAATLLDTHTLIWFLAGEPLVSSALFEIAKAQSGREVFVASISAWEAGLAILKPRRAPNLLGLSADLWFQRGVRKIGARTIPLTYQIALEVARVPAIYGSGDPGDGFLIATAHVRNLSLVTRDRRMREFARATPGYLRIIPC